MLTFILVFAFVNVELKDSDLLNFLLVVVLLLNWLRVLFLSKLKRLETVDIFLIFLFLIFNFGLLSFTPKVILL